MRFSVLISVWGDSYDHLHLEALLALNARSTSTSQNSRPIRFFVPLGVKALLVSAGIDEERVYELDWWMGISFAVPLASPSPRLPPSPTPEWLAPPPTPTPELEPTRKAHVTITLTPAQHNSGRGVLDQGATLWGSWAVKQVWGGRAHDYEGGGEGEREANVWFAGDTGYQTSEGACPVFEGPSPSLATSSPLTHLF
jgi:N-acyl-phosphatidylethanolamine-hydrolysing phospholipase D